MSTNLRLLVTAGDVDEDALALVRECVDDWFPADTPMAQDDFIDTLCERYGNTAGWDIEQLDTPAVRKIMREARRVRRDAG